MKINVGELKSMSALPTLRQCLNNRPDNLETIIIASAMFEISNHDDGDELANICLEAFKPIEDDINSTYGVYGVIHAFFFLAKFRNPQIRSIIAKYIDHPEVLISANAKSALARIDK